ncbi:hypothetical protein GGF46_003119 [Coemansia sp. RSA 552]|nr:hypothetical protein GGF46_003119 [Coemansia sp. RSA 552]
MSRREARASCMPGLLGRVCGTLGIGPPRASRPDQSTGSRPAIVIHAGAGNILREKMSREEEESLRAGLHQAAEAGYAVLAKGGAAVDAVESAVRALEDNPLFNAGKGAVFNADGVNQLEASLMDGQSGAAGAATLLTVVKNPVSLARKVMESNVHVFLGGSGAEKYAKETGLDIVDPSYFWTRHRWEQHERGYIRTSKTQSLAGPSSSSSSCPSGTSTHATCIGSDPDSDYSHLPLGTVGAVAIDVDGRLAAATSTGGMSNKWDGRIGDTPIIGAGTFADKSVAVSATGAGEYFIRQGTARYIASRVQLVAGETASQASQAALREMKAMGGDGGVICIDASGCLSMTFCSPGMYRACCSASTGHVPRVGIFGDETIAPDDTHVEM